MNTVAVVTCVWKRPERLRYTLDMLACQSEPVDVLLINNNAELEELVDRHVENTDADIRVWHNGENRGPYARLEVMHECRDEYEWFVWVDDDLRFGCRLVEQWMLQRVSDTLMGWKGFNFAGHYWERAQVTAGELCDYLLGSNVLVPARAMRDDGVLDLPREYRLCCDDLWLSFYASHVLGMPLRAGKADVSINIDGKDTYLLHHDRKMRLLDELRAQGWKV